MEKRENTTAITSEAKTETRRIGGPACPYIPAVDIIDGDDGVLLLSDLPGADESGIDITLEKNILTIKAKPAAEEFEGHRLLYAEYGMGDYQRSFSLSEEVDRDGITASIRDGVLRLKIPKAKSVTKKIAVANV